MKKLAILFSSAAAVQMLMSAEIAWKVSPNTCSDSDVQTEGRCLYAYTPSTDEINVNGVQFNRWTVLNDYITANETLYSIDKFADDASFDTPITRNRNVNWLGSDQSAAWTGGDDYRRLLQWAWYSGEKIRTLTLKGLVPGKRYLVQIWICDARSTSAASKLLSMGGVTGNCYGNGFGSNFTGVFTADAETQDVNMTYVGEVNFTAFQVRCLDEAHMTWTKSWTSGESDVRTDGKLLYAYKARDPLVVANTFFNGNGTSYGLTCFGDKASPDIKFSKPVYNPGNTFCWSSEGIPAGAYSYSIAYSNLVTCGYHETYSGRYNRRDVTLRNLTPGLRYLVQLWMFDNRSGTYASRSAVIGNGVVLRHGDGTTYGHGAMAVGTFTAVSSEQTFSCYHRTSGEEMKSIQEMFGPIQVRCLDEEDEGWLVGDTEADGSVDTRGKPLYAFSGVRTEVSGTPFASFNGQTGDYVDLAFTDGDALVFQNWNYNRPFIQGAKIPVSDSVTNLLANGVHCDVSAQTIEIRHLVPGRRYLVQIWLMDARSGAQHYHTIGGKKVYDRILAGDDFNGTSCTYDKAPLGQYATVVFRATDDVFHVPCVAGHGALHINAIQVRELDTPLDSEIRWSLAETLPGEASVSTEGNLLYAYAPESFTSANGVQFAQGAYNAVDIGGGNVVLGRKFTGKYGAFADSGASPLFRNAWFTYTSDVNNGENTVTLGNLKPAHAYLVQLFVADLREGLTSVHARTMTIKDFSGRYGPDDEDNFSFGSVFTGRFTADSVSKSFTMKATGYNTSQLNAIQVRELGPVQAVRDPNSAADWICDGAGWLVDGEDQSGNELWNAAAGTGFSAFVDGDAKLSLGSDVTFGALYGTGCVEIGDAGTEFSVTALGEISAPTVTVNAVWSRPGVRKTTSGVTVLAGQCPLLKFVDAWQGRIVLDGACDRSLDISVSAPGELGFSAVRELDISSLLGDGTLAGPGGIRFTNGGSFTVPAGIKYADGFFWAVDGGSTLVLQDGCDAASVAVRVDNPSAYVGRPVVRCEGTVTGRPAFTFGSKGWRAAYSPDVPGWIVKSTGAVISFR